MDMMNQTIIRPMHVEDNEQIKALMLEYICDFYHKEQPPASKIDNLINMLTQQKEGIQFVAEHHGELIGFATLYFSYSTLSAQKVVVLNDLYVRNNYRGTGVAEKLFQKCVDYKDTNNFAFMSWETAPDNTRAQNFYKKMGGVKGEWLTYSI
ncbi:MULTISPECIES: GNAT family N-acetyltransferase [Bacillaceae]|uniref:GNAT family N-acetyltransferase n=1 Tax=Bacillaceae TaxID=186817 RepID=UPI002A151E30|nr:GNAT family N-acetyltransferase [Cytobacillus sp. IB215316]MDX8362072.1 GNAT family N-acetyltransferase [Cytobacillus sp. IB215316]